MRKHAFEHAKTKAQIRHMVFAQLIRAFVCAKLTDFILAVSSENTFFLMRISCRTTPSYLLNRQTLMSR